MVNTMTVEYLRLKATHQDSERMATKRARPCQSPAPSLQGTPVGEGTR